MGKALTDKLSCSCDRSYFFNFLRFTEFHFLPGKEARFWAASITYHLNPMEREVLVSFTKPLEEHGFKEYEVTLKDLIDGHKQRVYITEVNGYFSIL